MGTEEKLSFSVPAGTVTRGQVVNVRVNGERSQYRTVRLELLQVERKLKAKLEAKKNHAVVVSTTQIPEGQSHLQLTIPNHLPNAHHGEIIGWDYELRLVGDRPGRPDHEQVEAIDVGGFEPAGGSSTALMELRRSKGARLAALESGSSDKMREVVISFGLLAVVAVAFWLVKDETLWLVMGLGAAALAGGGVFKMFQQRRLGLHDVQFHVPNVPVRLGQPVVVQVGNAIGRSLEVGLVAIEISVESGGKHPIAVQHRHDEKWLPVVGATVSLPTSTSMPSGFAGEYNSLHWLVELRDANATPNIQSLTARREMLALTH